ncbi:tyrosine-type recombinase/integrase [uncultured Sphingomonas sp.]|uniref:tyrosine-type recombinase/integrase n=1 Tax=uncultured Sphingomonas sp. TaxID=158754 RepID=UPI002614E9DA|nr:tyrosine-type recombinase/integrase [uncultured Sphingomonas sp.]
MTAVNIRWQLFPLTSRHVNGKEWLDIQHMLGLASNTVEAYGRGLEQFLRWCEANDVAASAATRPNIASYVAHLRTLPGARKSVRDAAQSTSGLSSATLHQRLTAIRLFFDYLVEEGVRTNNPVGRGRFVPNRPFSPKRDRGLIRRHKSLPWIPSDEEWHRFLLCAKDEPIRNRCMLAIAYDAALRREELCAIETRDIDPAHRLILIRGETSKSNRDRIVPYSETAGVLFAAYLEHRRRVARDRGRLFLSESRRNYGEPITLWTWSKVIRRIAIAADLDKFSTHTLRHLCLTDLARAGWDIHEIAQLAGHRNLASTQQYIHLSGRDLSRKLAGSMEQIHAWRTRMLVESSPERDQ